MSPKVLAKLADDSFLDVLAGSDASFDFEKRLQGELIKQKAQVEQGKKTPKFPITYSSNKRPK
jgi:hypothetical protein